MRLVPDSGTLALRGSAQWRRAVHQHTATVGEVVQLATVDAVSPPAATGSDFTGGFAGLAFDQGCRLFHAQPEAAAIEFVFWGRTDAVGVHEDRAEPFAFTGSARVAAGALPKRPLALASDGTGFLYVADPNDLAVWLVDIRQKEVARRVVFKAPPLDLAARAGAVYVLLGDGTTWQVAPCESPERTRFPAVPGAERLALGSDGSGRMVAWVLSAPGRSTAALQALHATLTVPAAYCTDVLVEPAESESPSGTHVLVLAQRPGEELRRLQLGPDGSTALVGLVAPHYDGRGIETAPDGRVAYFTGRGVRHAAPARGRYVQTGLLFTTALDSEQDQSRWGRILVEACVPTGTRIQFRAFTRDDLDYDDAIGGPPAPGVPPVLSSHTWETHTDEPHPLYRDSSARPLSPLPVDGFASYDAPIPVARGRYLWLVFSLEGTRTKTPRLRSVRIEYPGHALLGVLPRTLWREPPAREFLFRFLAPMAAMLDEWEGVSSARHRLLDPRITPSAALPWLAQFVGLVLDPCWPNAAQRRLIAEAASLFRTRGTLGSLTRMLELLTDAEVLIIENFRMRGGGVVGNARAIVSQAVLGAGYRVGGRIGEPAPLPIAEAPPPDFDDFAHRFTVTIVAALDDAQLASARRLIEQHKPAHTDFTLCTARAGLRVGVGSHIGVSSIVGESSGFEPAIVGDAALGAGFVLGRPALQGDDQ
jgi:phage tail-like protein